MSSLNLIPVLPESAPFTAEQRAYLNGFFAGLFSRGPAPAGAAPASPLTQPLSILFGSQTGNAETLAKRIAKEAGRRGFAPTVHDLAKYPTAQLASERNLLVITSTFGDGEPPDNARAFWDFLASEAAPRLTEVRFSVCALGDSNYPQFCAFGRAVDGRLERLGATRAHPRVDCDVDYESALQQWQGAALAAMGSHSPSTSNSQLEPTMAAAATPITRPQEATHSRSHPFRARLLTNRRLSSSESDKEVRHFEISLQGSALDYQAGDALGVFPENDPSLVAELLAALGATGEEPVPGRSGESVPLRVALTGHYEITRIPRPLLELYAARSGDALLQQVSSPTANGELTKYLWGREVIDLLLAHPQVKMAPGEFIGLLKKLQPRLYSISSSPKAHPGEVHLTVNTVRYRSLDRARAGVCSTYLADRVGPETPVPVFIHSNPSFRPPSPELPLIMIGPGTGIAPFRAFLEERRASGATGRNWLFFGDQRSATDFLYRDELERFQQQGLLTRLDLAWSRDQASKVYVQNRMLERATELFAWLEAGAGFYVCGDASRMAKDVDAALHQVVEKASGRTTAQAAEYINALKAAKRYQRDVY